MTTIFQKPVYQAQGRLLIKTPTGITSALPQDESGEQKQIGELSPVGLVSDPLKTEIGLILSPSLAQKVTKTLNLELEPEELLEQISVKNIEETDILEISYQSTDREEAALAVNQLMKLYLENNVLANRTEAAAAREFIVKQLPKTEATVHQAEVGLRKFEEQNNVVDLEQEASSAVGVITNLENQISQAQSELADVTAQSQVLRNNLGMRSQQAIAESSINQSPGVQKALEEYQQTESQLAVARTRYQESHPEIVELKSKKASLEALLQGRVEGVIGNQNQKINANSQIENIRQQITTELVTLEARRLGLVSRVSALSNLLANYKQRLNDLPSLKQQKRELERAQEAGQSTYQTLLRRLEEIRVEENRNVGNVRIVEPAQIPEEPVAPDPMRNLTLGSVLGIFLAIGTALVLEALDTSIKTTKEAREAFGYTLQGIIPFSGKFEKLTLNNRDPEQSTPKIVVRDAPGSPISEPYRMLQANLKFVNSDKELKTIVVTSSVPKEGKSTVSANLAMVIAQSGRKVLLVDADMRRPLQHQIWNLLNEAGLSNVLIGQAELRTTVKQVAVNLHVLSAGSVPPNPMALLDSKRMASLIENFSESYDFVIFDTPSLKVAADALILGKMADSVLLVVRPGVVDSASAASAKELLQQSGQNVVGQVVNGVNEENKPYSYYTKEYYAEKKSPTREKVMFESGKNADRY